MVLKNLLVHLDSSGHSAHRLAVAVDLAARHRARLSGIFAECAQAHRVGVVASWPSEAYAQAAEASRQGFEQATAGLAAASWHDADRGGSAEVINAVTARAGLFDLVILGQDDDTGKSAVPADLPEEVILHSGRPGLVLPYVGETPSFGRRPLIAWNHSREAIRAINDALPLMAGCDEAWVITFSRHCTTEQDSTEELLHHLADHGIAARSECIFVDEVGVMDMLLNRCSDHGADLLVMGAQPPTALQSLGRGSGARYILKHMTMPVLMAG